MLLLQPPFKRNHIPFHHNIIIYRYKYVVRFFFVSNNEICFKRSSGT